MKNITKKQPIFWISVVKIFATLLIFTFHYKKLLVPSFSYTMALVAIALFVFIAGFLIKSARSPENWLYTRLLSICLPYWLILIPLILINYLIKYKEVSILSLIIQFLGGSLFIQNRLFTISWFVTFIIGFYLIGYIIKKLKKFKIINLISLLILLNLIFIQFIGLDFLLIWSACFLLGYLMRNLNLLNFLSKIPINAKLNYIFFRINQHTYSFFLVHGPILLFLINMLKLSPLLSLIYGLSASIIVSLILFYISNKIIGKISKKFKFYD